MDNGWIKIWRKIIGWGWFTTPNMFHLFIYLIIAANIEEKEWKGQIIKRGQLATGLHSLHKNTGISIQSIRTCLARLKSTNEITIKSTNRFSIITIIKYEEYQLKPEKSTNKSTNSLTNNQQTTNKQLTTTKEYKNIRSKEDIAEQSSAIIIPNLLNAKQKHIQIIGLYQHAKKINFSNLEQQRSFIARNVKAANALSGYEIEKIIDTMKWLINNAEFKWTIETVGKYIDEDLATIPSGNKVNDEDILKELLNK